MFEASVDDAAESEDSVEQHLVTLGSGAAVSGGRCRGLRGNADRRSVAVRRWLSLLIPLVAVVAGCSSGGAGNPTVPTIPAAKVYRLGGFQPAGVIQPGRPITLAFSVVQPSGAPLVRYRTGPGPHTGIHLIIVPDDLSSIVHLHPPVSSTGQVSQRVVLPNPGPYRVLVDIYPAHQGPGYVNYQLTKTIHVAGAYHPKPLPPFAPDVTVDGYRFAMHGLPTLHVAQAALVKVTVTDPSGRPATFTSWFGALAHAIFFHKGNLAYFHTHVCAPGLAGCTSIGGVAPVTGSSTKPGLLNVGVLVPEAGTWKLFLQCQVNGHILTAPYTLHVK
ncbi:MAG: hypothetical protein QOG33_541 [Gaiellales bacterium]|nr:hypothetical protein [Gaiellales bacterium]